ncbi:MAG: hypothetical protein KGZ63_12405 [Clostridiales bacterium]|jgi:hypothetical protein|nr:hypothetical protein [Clostridiales bacterium]
MYFLTKISPLLLLLLIVTVSIAIYLTVTADSLKIQLLYLLFSVFWFWLFSMRLLAKYRVLDDCLEIRQGIYKLIIYLILLTASPRRTGFSSV